MDIVAERLINFILGEVDWNHVLTDEELEQKMDEAYLRGLLVIIGLMVVGIVKAIYS